MSRVVLRTATMDDIEELGDIYRRASLSNDGDRAALLATPDVLCFDSTNVAQNLTRVAVVNGRLIGFATTLPAGDVLELEDLFVDPDWMRQGIGQRLIADALASAEASGHIGIEVTANPHALDFYTSVGFVGTVRIDTQLGEGLRMRVTAATR